MRSRRTPNAALGRGVASLRTPDGGPVGPNGRPVTLVCLTPSAGRSTIRAGHSIVMLGWRIARACHCSPNAGHLIVQARQRTPNDERVTCPSKPQRSERRMGDRTLRPLEPSSRPVHRTSVSPESERRTRHSPRPLSDAERPSDHPPLDATSSERRTPDSTRRTPKWSG
jgi:hypothetical protein